MNRLTITQISIICQTVLSRKIGAIGLKRIAVIPISQAKPILFSWYAKYAMKIAEEHTIYLSRT
jgi:hypothetical protein